MPIPTAWPLIAAMTGLRHSHGWNGSSGSDENVSLVGVAKRRALREVGTCAERSSRTGDHDDPDRVVGIGVTECSREGGTHLARERVHRLGPVEGDDEHAGIVVFDQDGVGRVGHRRRPYPQPLSRAEPIRRRLGNEVSRSGLIGALAPVA